MSWAAFYKNKLNTFKNSFKNKGQHYTNKLVLFLIKLKKNKIKNIYFFISLGFYNGK